MAMTRRPILIVFGGLPGTGKSTISQPLARALGATYLRVDAVEQTMKNAGVENVGAVGYMVANALALANLRLEQTVVVDCVNPVAASRIGWQKTASRAAVPLAEIEIVCSDPEEHRRRVEGRSVDIPGLAPPSWADVTTRQFERWAGGHLVLDTAAMPFAEAVNRAEAFVRNQVQVA
jgi:predicted kinase